ncbi:MAG: glycosyltransferase [Firmicutes bacterium]|nr:glycosyltransferase [Bacillota bacterium]
MLWAEDSVARLCLFLFAVYGLWSIGRDLGRKYSPGKRRDKPFVSILVIAYDDEVRIEGVIRWLLGLGYVNAYSRPNFELVAISGSSADETAAILKRLAREKAGLVVKAVERNRVYEEGLALCRGEVVFLMDLAKQPIRVTCRALEKVLNG